MASRADYQVGGAGEGVSLAAAGLAVAEYCGGEPVDTHLYQPAQHCDCGGGAEVVDSTVQCYSKVPRPY